MEYECSVCKGKVEGDVLVYMNHTESHIIEEIKNRHPEWADTDGLCQKCVDYYKDQIKGSA
jgi:5-methylcytosine-specific restriction endonuclease McrA